VTDPSKRTAVLVRTRDQVLAQVAMLSGAPSRARAALDDTETGAPSSDTGETVGELWLYGVVGGWWRGFDAESVSNALRGMDVDVLHVRIHSPGGYASDGVAIANLLRNHRARVVVVVDGLAASAASVIAVAGDEIIMCPGSQLMIHDASTYAYGNAAELRNVADWIDGQSANYSTIYAHKAGSTPEFWRTVMTANQGLGTWYGGEAAVAAKLADRVGTLTAIGSPPVAPEDDFDEGDDELLARAEHDLQILETCVPASVRAAWNGERPKPPTASADGSTTPKERSSLVTRISDAAATTIGQKLGVAEDADEATLLAALDEALNERSEPTPTVPAGHVVVPQARLDDLEAGARAGTAAAQKLHDQEREAFLDANARKFATANRAAWATEYDRNPEGTRQHFASAPDLVPAAELGHAIDNDNAEGAEPKATVSDDPKYKSWSF